MMNLYSIHMPLELILKSSKLFNDIKTGAKEWQKRIDEVSSQETETIQVEETNMPRVDNNVIGADNDNSSKE